MATATVMDPIIRTGLLATSDSSARAEYRGASILISVHGPIEAKSMRTRSSAVFADVTVRTPSGIPGSRERSIEEAMRSVVQFCIKPIQSSPLDIVITVDILSDSAHTLSACVVGLMAALHKSTIQLEDTAVASIYIPAPSEGSELVAPSSPCIEVVASAKSGCVIFSKLWGSAETNPNTKELVEIAIAAGQSERESQLRHLQLCSGAASKHW